MNSFKLSKFIKVSILSLALLPVLKENVSSVIIIICTLLVVANKTINNKKILLNKDFWILTIIFWLFFFNEIITGNLNYKTILINLSFLAFPIVFANIKEFLTKKLTKKFIAVFQASTLLHSLISLFFFLYKYEFNELFKATPENIPVFRRFFYNKELINIHPTYFSSFLLVTFIFSMNSIINNDKRKLLSIIISVFSVFFIFILSSKIVIISLLVSILFFLVIFLKKAKKSTPVIAFIGLFFLFISILYPNKEIVFSRFKQIKTEIYKPIDGKYYNSTNIRVAIFKCSKRLLKKLPFFGYGNELQNKLNECYKNTYNSDFYIKNIYNTHNYYLNILLYGGWLYLLLFTCFIIYLFFKLKDNPLAKLLLTIFLIINLTENYFSRHYGIVLFCTFIFYFKNINFNASKLKKI